MSTISFAVHPTTANQPVRGGLSQCTEAHVNSAFASGLKSDELFYFHVTTASSNHGNERTTNRRLQWKPLMPRDTLYGYSDGHYCGLQG
eukprot:m.271963 g.271963  ORF g.271963 m.271963 type:complete len:89 (+) comp19746_c0_seq48:4374-4640(+)